MEWLINILVQSKQISSKIALPAFVFLGLVLVLPASYIEMLGLVDFSSAYKLWIGVVFLLSATVLLSNFVWWTGDKAKPWVSQWIFIRENRKSLNNLTEDEKIILRCFIIDGEAAVYEGVGSGPINLLLMKKVVYRPSNLSAHFTSFAFVLQPWAREYLSKHTHLLD